MPGSEKVQPARQSWRIQGGQDTIERHAGLDVVMEKIVQWEQAIPGLQRPRTNRRFPPLGVKAVESDRRATQKAPVARRGGA